MVFCDECKKEMIPCTICGVNVDVENRSKAVINWEYVANGSLSRKIDVMNLCKGCTLEFSDNFKHKKRPLLKQIKDKNKLR